MHSGEIHCRRIGRDRAPKIPKRIKWRRRANELRRSRIEYRIGPIQNAIEKGRRNLGAGLDVLRLAVAKSRVVTPATIEQFVTLEADRCEISIRLIVEQTISE